MQSVKYSAVGYRNFIIIQENNNKMTSLSPETGAELSEANIGSKIGSCIKEFKAPTVSAITFLRAGGRGGIGKES